MALVATSEACDIREISRFSRYDAHRNVIGIRGRDRLRDAHADLALVFIDEAGNDSVEGIFAIRGGIE